MASLLYIRYKNEQVHILKLRLDLFDRATEERPVLMVLLVLLVHL